MGILFSKISVLSLPEAWTPLIGYEIKRVFEVHAAFVSLCDSFGLCFKECEQLFNMNEATFAIWDNDSKGLVDAFQLFSVVCVCSSGRPEDKARFLFELYSFAGFEGIWSVTVEFMCSMVIDGLCKLYHISTDTEATTEVQALISENFPKSTEITQKQLVEWAISNETVNQYLTSKLFK